MSIALLVVTDGRDAYLDQAVPSALMNLRGDITEWWMFDDTGDTQYRQQLTTRYPRFAHINGERRQGFGGAIRAAWSHLLTHSTARFVFHLEADFVFRRPVDLAAMADVLDAQPHLAQMALRRQPWNADEYAAGGVVERYPDAYTECRDATGNMWLEHRLFFTTNPSLYRRSLCVAGWPTGAQSEGRFSHRLLATGLPGVAGSAVQFGFWGARDSGVWVEHVGHERTGTGY